MERVVTINLNGRSYQLEEGAYDALRAYMDLAERALADNPDRAEIMRDLEQAVADKCAAVLGAQKNVVNAEEMRRVIDEMGPVAGAEARDESAPGGASASPQGSAKRLYRIKNGAWISGVCAGIGAYFDLDPTIVRILFVIAAFVTSGVAIIVYIVLMFVTPSAHTSEEWAAAHGLPFNAQEVIDRAKREYAQFTGPNGPMRRGRAHRHERNWHTEWSAPYTPAPAGAGMVSYTGRVFAGFAHIILSLISAAMLVAFILAVWSLAASGTIIGFAPLADIPVWLAIIILALVFALVSAPVAALREASHAAMTGAPRARHHHGGGGALMLVAVGLFAWLAYAQIDEVRLIVDQLAYAARALLTHEFHRL